MSVVKYQLKNSHLTWSSNLSISQCEYLEINLTISQWSWFEKNDFTFKRHLSIVWRILPFSCRISWWILTHGDVRCIFVGNVWIERENLNVSRHVHMRVSIREKVNLPGLRIMKKKSGRKRIHRWIRAKFVFLTPSLAIACCENTRDEISSRPFPDFLAG